MKSPCIAVCKNNHGICSGCLRTMEEITGWRYLPETEQISKINQIRAIDSTHTCPNCGENSFCEISAGKERCWCFDIEKRDLSSTARSGVCLCRKCLSSLPIE
ncbi:cysteine-rich CWC family protein [Vibrio rhodolitus]|uniref:cysteine-rich CWC family protein n=1 Tax=Vibrio rhodolitus TaxID=2231649 RepID=UPI000E0AE4ED|nr:cysteine-rich CWC family protein [Vibrio rhodolitus]